MSIPLPSLNIFATLDYAFDSNQAYVVKATHFSFHETADAYQTRCKKENLLDPIRLNV